MFGFSHISIILFNLKRYSLIVWWWPNWGTWLHWKRNDIVHRSISWIILHDWRMTCLLICQSTLSFSRLINLLFLLWKYWKCLLRRAFYILVRILLVWSVESKNMINIFSKRSWNNGFNWHWFRISFDICLIIKFRSILFKSWIFLCIFLWNYCLC